MCPLRNKPSRENAPCRGGLQKEKTAKKDRDVQRVREKKGPKRKGKNQNIKKERGPVRAKELVIKGNRQSGKRGS